MRGILLLFSGAETGTTSTPSADSACLAEAEALLRRCRVTMLATYLSAVLALLLLWNVYPKDFDYGAAAGNGLLFYSANVGHLCSPLVRNVESHILDGPHFICYGARLAEIP